MRLIEEDDVATCSCRRTRDKKMAASRCCTDDTCENFSTQTECLVGFCSKSRCGNQRLQRRQWAAIEVMDAGPKGLGLRAVEPIARGELIAEYCGEVINDAEYQLRMEELARTTRHFYLMTLGRGEYLDAGRQGSIARFINHCCAPNARVEIWAVGGESVAGVFATEEIPAGAEITFNYGWNRAVRRMVCYCGVPTCTGYIGLRSDEAHTADALPEGRFREPTEVERASGTALVGEWVQLLWEGDKGLGENDSDDDNDDKDAGESENEGRNTVPDMVAVRANGREGASNDGLADKRYRHRATRRTMAVTARGCWYTGRVTAYDAATETYTIRYAADGEVCDGETLAQPECKWRILERVRSRAEAEELSRRLRTQRAAAAAANVASASSLSAGVRTEAADDISDEYDSYEADEGVLYFDDDPGLQTAGEGLGLGSTTSHTGAVGGSSGNGRRIVSTLVVPRRQSRGGDGGDAPSATTMLGTLSQQALGVSAVTNSALSTELADAVERGPYPLTPVGLGPAATRRELGDFSAGGDGILAALSAEKVLSDAWRIGKEALQRNKEAEVRAVSR